MQDKEKSRHDLVDRLGQDEALQKAAVAALLERSDARSWSIVQQVNLVQSQLAALTSIEMEKKNFEMNQQLVNFARFLSTWRCTKLQFCPQNDIADRRMALSAILVDLLDQQEIRRQQLLETIHLIEEQRNVDVRKIIIWFRGQTEECEFCPTVREEKQFVLADAVSIFDGGKTSGTFGDIGTEFGSTCRHRWCFTLFAFFVDFAFTFASHRLGQAKIGKKNFVNFYQLYNMNYGINIPIFQIGIINESDQEAIKLAVENYLAEKKLETTDFPVSAAVVEEPSGSEKPATAPSEDFASHGMSECVVCMDAEVNSKTNSKTETTFQEFMFKKIINISVRFDILALWTHLLLRQLRQQHCH